MHARDTQRASRRRTRCIRPHPTSGARSSGHHNAEPSPCRRHHRPIVPMLRYRDRRHAPGTPAPPEGTPSPQSTRPSIRSPSRYRMRRSSCRSAAESPTRYTPASQASRYADAPHTSGRTHPCRSSRRSCPQTASTHSTRGYAPPSAPAVAQTRAPANKHARAQAPNTHHHRP